MTQARSTAYYSLSYKTISMNTAAIQTALQVQETLRQAKLLNPDEDIAKACAQLTRGAKLARAADENRARIRLLEEVRFELANRGHAQSKARRAMRMLDSILDN